MTVEVNPLYSHYHLLPSCVYIQARRQGGGGGGGVRGGSLEPSFWPPKDFIYTVNCILSSLSFENGPVVSLLSRIATVQTNLVAATEITWLLLDA